MMMCTRCHKNVAVVFITKLENGKTINEGLCLKCAKDMGLPAVDKIMPNMPDVENLSEEEMENMTNQLADLFGTPKSNVKHWERERSFMQYDNFIKIKRFFDIQ